MTSEKQGFSLIEIVVIVGIMALLLGLSAVYYNKTLHHRYLDSAAKQVCEVMQTAHSYAASQNKHVTVVFNERTFAVFTEDGKLVGKENCLPQFVVVKEKSQGFSPAEFMPDGTAREAGYVILEEIHSQRRARITLYNITGQTTWRYDGE